MIDFLLFDVRYKIKDVFCKIGIFFRPATIQIICLFAVVLAALSIYVFNIEMASGLYAVVTGIIGSSIVAIIVEMGNNRRFNRRRLFFLRDYYKMLSTYELDKERWTLKFTTPQDLMYDEQLEFTKDLADRFPGDDLYLWKEALDIVEEKKMINVQTDCVEIFAIAHSIDSIMNKLFKAPLSVRLGS